MIRHSVLLALGLLTAVLVAEDRHPVPAGHPRLLGSRTELQALARQRPAEYQRLAAVARQGVSDNHAAIVGLFLDTLPPAACQPPVAKGEDLCRCDGRAFPQAAATAAGVVVIRETADLLLGRLTSESLFFRW